MTERRLGELLARYLGGAKAMPKALSAEQRARNLIAAVDTGGLPLNPMIVNDIARQLGLVVDVDAQMTYTVERIRGVLSAVEGGGGGPSKGR
jgi:hypothetical protein